jgi:hypothetical protein
VAQTKQRTVDVVMIGQRGSALHEKEQPIAELVVLAGTT